MGESDEFDKAFELITVHPETLRGTGGERIIRICEGADGRWVLYHNDDQTKCGWIYFDAAGVSHPRVVALLMTSMNLICVQDGAFGLIRQKVVDLAGMRESDIFDLTMEMLNILRFNSAEPVIN